MCPFRESKQIQQVWQHILRNDLIIHKRSDRAWLNRLWLQMAEAAHASWRTVYSTKRDGWYGSASCHGKIFPRCDEQTYWWGSDSWGIPLFGMSWNELGWFWGAGNKNLVHWWKMNLYFGQFFVVLSIHFDFISCLTLVMIWNDLARPIAAMNTTIIV